MIDKQRETFEKTIRYALEDVHIETGKVDEFDRVVDCLVSAVVQAAQQAAGAEPSPTKYWQQLNRCLTFVEVHGWPSDRLAAAEVRQPQPPKAEPELLSNIKELPPGFKPHAQQHKEVPMVTYGPDQAGGGQFGICVQCGKGPTPEGHDGCLGTLPGPIINACCGHGRASTAYIQYREEDSKDASIIEGVDALLEQNRLISIRDGQPSKAAPTDHPGPSTTAFDDQEAPDE